MGVSDTDCLAHNASIPSSTKRKGRRRELVRTSDDDDDDNDDDDDIVLAPLPPPIVSSAWALSKTCFSWDAGSWDANTSMHLHTVDWKGQSRARERAMWVFPQPGGPWRIIPKGYTACDVGVGVSGAGGGGAGVVDEVGAAVGGAVAGDVGVGGTTGKGECCVACG